MHLDIVAVEPQEVSSRILTSGRIAFDDSRVTHVVSPVSGRITRLVATLGARVRQGDTLARIASPDIGSASADLSKAEADALTAEHDARRQRDLVAAGAAARRDAEVAEDVLRRAQAELARARERMQLFGHDVDRVTQEFTLRAPIDGEVIARNAQPGAEITGQYAVGGSADLFTIGELDRVWLIGDIYEVDLQRVRVGETCAATVVAYPDRQFSGVIDWISGVLDPQTRTARVRCSLDNADRALRPEMFATVSITTASRRVLAIPRSAILHLGDQTVAFVDRGAAPAGRERFERTPVSVDEPTTAQPAPVLRGLDAGDRVVARGAIQLSGMF
jgi:cobalt-zinc-cadmium efflux system membrane fusion protein